MEPTISASQLHQQLTTDPGFALSFILQNNPEAVANNLIAMGFQTPRDESDMRRDLAGLISSGQGDLFAQALSVQLITTNLLPEQVATVIAVNQAMQGHAGIDHAWQKSDTDHIGMTEVLSGIAVGVLTMLGTTPGAASTTTDSGGAAAPPPPPKKDQTWKVVGYILGGVALVVTIVLIVRWARNRNK